MVDMAVFHGGRKRAGPQVGQPAPRCCFSSKCGSTTGELVVWGISTQYLTGQITWSAIPPARAGGSSKRSRGPKIRTPLRPSAQLVFEDCQSTFVLYRCTITANGPIQSWLPHQVGNCKNRHCNNQNPKQTSKWGSTAKTSRGLTLGSFSCRPGQPRFSR